MPTTEPAPERSRLRFAAAVSEAFGFLLRSGFEVVERSDTFVRFESERRVVRVFHGRASYEVGVEIGRWIDVGGTRREQFFPLRYIVSLTHDPDVGLRGTTATTVNTVRSFVDLLGGLTLRFASRLLNDGDDAFEELSARSAARGVADREAQRAVAPDASRRSMARPRLHGGRRLLRRDRGGMETVELSRSERGRLDYARRALDG